MLDTAESPTRHSTPTLANFADRLLAVLLQVTPEAPGTDTAEFKTKIEQFRREVVTFSGRPELSRVIEACILTCQAYLKRSVDYHHDREAELTEMVTILRDAAKLMMGESSQYNAQILSSSQRFNNLAQLEDMRDLKRKLVAEVSTLKQTVEDKQRRETQAFTELSTRVETLQSRLTQVEEEASLDPLTRIANRGRFDRMLSRHMNLAKQNGTPLALAMIDVDDFKKVNDTHGHPIGDRVLLCTAQWLGKGLRQTDLVARYGGEEFAVLLPNATANQVEDRIKRLIAEIAGNSYEYELLGKKERVQFTVSCGLTEIMGNETEDDILKRADEALYEAKRKGKNRLVARKRSLLGNLLSR